MSGTFCDKFNNIRDLSIHDFNIRELNIRSCTALCAAQSGAGVPLICCVVEAQPGVSPTQGTSRQMCPRTHGTSRQMCPPTRNLQAGMFCTTWVCWQSRLSHESMYVTWVRWQSPLSHEPMSLGCADSPLGPTDLCHLGVLTVPSVPWTYLCHLSAWTFPSPWRRHVMLTML